MPPAKDAARSLLRAATSARRIADPFASYHPVTSKLTCSACGHLPIKHESLWASHANSKSHRENVARLRREREEKELQREMRERERRAAEAAEAAATKGAAMGRGKGAAMGRGKRAADEDGESATETRETQGEEGVGAGKRRRTELPPSSATNGRAAAITTAVTAEEEEDPEWAAFQREVLAQARDDAPAATPFQSQPDFIPASATIEAAPQLHIRSSRANGAADDRRGAAVEEMEVEEEEAPKEETEQERREREEREEKEEIFSRLEEEQRVQEEADERVEVLKRRMEAIKRRREERKKKVRA